MTRPISLAILTKVLSMTAGTHHTIECELDSVSPGDVPPEMTVQVVDDISEQRGN